MITIIDYGMGNIHSVHKALESFGAEVCVTNDPAAVERSEKLILPGVGAFGDTIDELDRRGLSRAIKKYINDKKIFLGICLGLQLLFESSEESPGKKGLSVLRGTVRRFKDSRELKVPHMGWNQLHASAARSASSLLRGISDDSNVYFCHSYYVDPENTEVIAGTTEYGIPFPSVIWKENVFGVQFHPEKSQKTGLAIIKNFVEMH
ncbi:MAG: imidazole glycerol phosphate synthase subunit HisH [Candidatus Omnitrophica bacterium]|nr:imidazole glycerol phosphate synthase subunit HisH [Candidatus Omnitrophota bacterium]